MRSIKKKVANKKRVLVGTSEVTKDYAAVHNYGLRSGRGAGFMMPKRQFIGHSKVLLSNIRKLIMKRTDKGFDK